MRQKWRGLLHACRGQGWMGGLGSDQPGQLMTSFVVRGCGELWASLLPTRWPLTSGHP